MENGYPSNDRKSIDEGMKCQVCGHLSLTAQEYEEHKLTHPLDGDDLATKDGQGYVPPEAEGKQ